MRISDWSSDVCSSDLGGAREHAAARDASGAGGRPRSAHRPAWLPPHGRRGRAAGSGRAGRGRGARAGRSRRARRVPTALSPLPIDDTAVNDIARFFRRLQWALVALAACWLVWLMGPVLTPFVVAALLGWLGDPLVDRL